MCCLAVSFAINLAFMSVLQ